MKAWRRLARLSSRLHARLIVAIALLLLVTEGVRMYVGYRDDRVEAERQARAFLVEVTRQRAAALAARLAGVMQATRSAAWFLGSGHLDRAPATLLDVLGGVVGQTPDIYGSAIAFESASDHPVYYAGRIGGRLTLLQQPDSQVHYSTRDWFVEPLRSGAPYWTEPYFDTGIGDVRMVTYSVPWHTRAGERAVVTADIALDAFDTGWQSPWGGASRLVDAHGHYLTQAGDIRAPGDGIFDIARKLELPQLEQAGKAMQRGESGLLEIDASRVSAGPLWLSWAPVGDTGWSMVALLEEDRVLANARAQLARQLALSLAALVLVLFTLAWTTRRLTRPLDALRRVAGAVRHGDATQRTGITSRRDELGQFAHTFDDMLDALAYSQAERMREAAQRQRIEGELAAAREIQQRLLPPPWPQWSRDAGPTPGFRFHGLCQPATLMSGDFYDAWLLDRDTVALVVADVCGKGTPAALYMTMVRTHLRDFASATRTPAQTLAAVNHVLATGGHDGMFVTLVLAHYRWRDGRLTLACGGHPPPLLLRADGRIEVIDGHGALVGAFDALDYADTQLQLASGDTLLLYTDGVTEAGADAGLYGQARLLARLGAARGLPPEAVADAIVAEVLAWCDQVPQDDVTLLAMQRGTPA
ncbi:MAG: HAMP domain-containing protein [Xanthomonadales bacterium]|nr:MAG: SpoIIE family protein phosphatase [Dokdonella sp.]MBC6942519.1 HAMP domain-containing protein [Xanthomonadales bacterium]MDL1867811.1 HAMP domain-containing protein [Gammaproteobacteria bacterium PRO6]